MRRKDSREFRRQVLTHPPGRLSGPPRIFRERNLTLTRVTRPPLRSQEENSYYLLLNFLANSKTPRVKSKAALGSGTTLHSNCVTRPYALGAKRLPPPKDANGELALNCPESKVWASMPRSLG